MADTTITQKGRNNMCEYCKVEIPKDLWWDIEARIMLTIGGWTTVYIGPDKEGHIGIMAVGDGTSDVYYPNFCPNCGRKLR